VADSLRLRILKAWATLLGTLTVAGGYHYTWADASIDPTTNLLTGVVAGEGPFATVEPTPEGSRQYFPADEIKDVMRGTVTVRHDIGNVLDPLARITVVENLIADLERAIATDYSLGGLVIDTRLLVPQPLVAVGSSMVLVVQPWEVRYRRVYGVPEGPL
jgi:hypothetical protein